MPRLAALGLAVLVAAVVFAEEKKPAEEKGGLDPAKLAGDWNYVSGWVAGKEAGKDELKGTVSITKDTITIPAGPEKYLIAYKLDTKADPVAIDMDIKSGPSKGKALGIIALDGDSLKLAYVVDDGKNKRPHKFESTKENNAFYFVLKRAK